MADVQASWLAVARRELQEWPLFGGRGEIQSAIDDYSQLLQRNKSCEENVSRLESVNIKLRKEKVDLVKEISTVKQEAHQDILRAEAALKERISFLETHAKELTDQLESTRRTLEDTTEQLSTAQEEIKKSKATIEQLEERNEQLNHDLEDMKEALLGETDARVAATSELEARLVAKERAESDKDKAEAQFRELKKNYLSKVDSLAKAQDAANEEFNKYKEMQRLLDLDRAAWDEQHKTLGRRSSNPAASFTLGSVFGGVANAIRGVGGQLQGVSGQGAQGEQQEDALASAVAAAKQQEEALDVPLVPEEEVVWPDVAPHPAAVLQRHEKVHGGGCNAITFSASGLHAATCGQDGVVRLWSTQDGTLSTELKPSHAQMASSINAVAFAEDKSMVMGASNDKSIKTWDMHSGRPRFTMTGHTKAVLGIKQHPSLMNMAVSCGEDRLIKVWSLAEGICQRSILCKSKPLDVAFTRDGQCIVSAHYDGSLRVFDASTGSDMRVVDPVHRKEVGPCVAVAPTGHTSRVVSVGRDNVVCVTDIQQGEVVHRFSSTLLSVGTQRCTPAVAPDDSVVCVGSSSGMVLLLNMETGNVEARLSCHSSAVSCVAWNGHSEYSNVVAGSVDKRGDVIFWRAKER